MKADLDDAPEWISSHSKRSKARMLLPGLIGTCITFGALHFGSQAFLQGTVQHIVEKEQEAQQTLRASVAEIKESEPSVIKDWDKVVDEASRLTIDSSQNGADKDTVQITKQTIFNDLNYTPQGAVNIIKAPIIYTEEKRVPEDKSKNAIIVIGKESRLRDYCPFREGSIEQRNCRMNVDLNGGR